MKYFYIFIAVLFFLSCAPQKNNELDYLLGKWERTNNQKDKITFEYWKKTEGNIYVGIGFTLQGKDTVFKENLRILKIDGIWNYEVTGLNPEPTYFKFTHRTDSSFVCENPKNEFPKKIKYLSSNNTLKATISDLNNKIEFLFVKKK